MLKGLIRHKRMEDRAEFIRFMQERKAKIEEKDGDVEAAEAELAKKYADEIAALEA